MRRHLTRSAWLLVVAALCVVQACHAQPAVVDSSLFDLKIDVAFLSADLLEGRETGTTGERLAAAYIARRFADVGLAPGVDGSWYQDFEFRHHANPHASDTTGEPRTGRNVVGFLDRGASRTVVIGAHYDHLGYGGLGSRQPEDSLIHNGADDNASGVAALVEVARRLSTSDARRHNVLFAAFSGEELGLHGSKHFIAAPEVAQGEINYMINLDMVGRLRADRTLAVNGTGTSPAWDAVLDAAAEATDLNLAKHESGLGPSDHASFYLQDIPVLHLFTGPHADYHKPSDDSHRINFDGLLDVATFTVRIAEGLDDDGVLDFQKTQDEEREVSFQVGLGIMPDYVYDGEGVRIDAVLEGRAAEQAGLQRGDVIIGLGDAEIEDVYAYMEALSQLEAGDVIPVTIRRGADVLEKEVRL